MARATLIGALLLTALLSACRGDEEGVFVTAPFNAHTRLARVDARWAAPGGGAVEFEIRVENLLADRLYVRLAGFALTAGDGSPAGRTTDRRACVLGPKATALVWAGSVDLSPEARGAIRGFSLDTFGVPLSERGQGIYREYVRQFQGRTAAQADAEIQGYANSPPCD